MLTGPSQWQIHNAQEGETVYVECKCSFCDCEETNIAQTVRLCDSLEDIVERAAEQMETEHGWQTGQSVQDNEDQFIGIVSICKDCIEKFKT